jgi:hypothetical protein
MKQAELDAAVKSVKESFRRIMTEKGYSQFIEPIENQVNYIDVVQFALQAAEDERHRIEKEEMNGLHAREKEKMLYGLHAREKEEKK